jgi:hypothetical protein
MCGPKRSAFFTPTALSVFPDYVHFKLIKLILMAKHGGYQRNTPKLHLGMWKKCLGGRLCYAYIGVARVIPSADMRIRSRLGTFEAA